MYRGIYICSSKRNTFLIFIRTFLLFGLKGSTGSLKRDYEVLPMITPFRTLLNFGLWK